VPREAILKVRDLVVSFERGRIKAVNGLNFDLESGQVVGLVGESGSGKSLTAFSLMGLTPYGAKRESGSITFKGLELTTLSPKERRELCGRQMGMVFQEPLTALNPVFTIGEQVAEIFRLRLNRKPKEAREMAVELLARVGLPNPSAAYKSYPHRFSGGMRQRVVIAMALALNPELVIADEPTTALDPTIASQIIRLLKDMIQERKTSVLFITHNLRLLTGLAQRALVMYAGVVVEETAADFSAALHPYSRGLIKALPPNPSQDTSRRPQAIPGGPPPPGFTPPGCPFEPRCAERLAICAQSLPPLRALPGQRALRCHNEPPC
jgi:oligopeptide/dipeptide ABC transporter ATP-binding protein